jgi:hypothetical protein
VQPKWLDKVLRFWQAGHCDPRLNRTTGHSPMGVPWHQTGTQGFLAASRDPHEFLDKGDVMIRRPYLAAEPAGSDWRTRRPSQWSIH